MFRQSLFLLLAFISGVHGFAILAPYLAFCVMAQTMIVQRRQRRAVQIIDEIPAELIPA